ncbi:hypothetical protein BGZ63DRAFT_178268 [Mariannaea sp. PMI_226]|nr:hypothetical protein BGZ63DRAFT_178268 [Mariannaea sp. PMI_226]
MFAGVRSSEGEVRGRKDMIGSKARVGHASSLQQGCYVDLTTVMMMVVVVVWRYCSASDKECGQYSAIGFVWRWKRRLMKDAYERVRWSWVWLEALGEVGEREGSKKLAANAIAAVASRRQRRRRWRRRQEEMGDKAVVEVSVRSVHSPKEGRESESMNARGRRFGRRRSRSGRKWRRFGARDVTQQGSWTRCKIDFGMGRGTPQV